MLIMRLKKGKFPCLTIQTPRHSPYHIRNGYAEFVITFIRLSLILMWFGGNYEYPKSVSSYKLVLLPNLNDTKGFKRHAFHNQQAL